MKIKSAYRFQMKEYLKGMAAYYGIVLLLAMGLYILFISLDRLGKIDLEAENIPMVYVVTSMFLFISAMAVNKEHFHMLIQNSVSRKAFFVARTGMILSVAAISSVVDYLFRILDATLNGKVNFETTSSLSMYGSYDLSNVGIVMHSILMVFLECAAAMAIGYLIVSVFYRVGNGLFVVIGFVVSIVAIRYLVVGAISIMSDSMMTFLRKLFLGYYDLLEKTPVTGEATIAVVFLLCSMISWLLLRKANIRKK